MVRRWASTMKLSRLAEVVCKNVFGLLVERTAGHDEDSRARPNKGDGQLKSDQFLYQAACI